MHGTIEFKANHRRLNNTACFYSFCFASLRLQFRVWWIVNYTSNNFTGRPPPSRKCEWNRLKLIVGATFRKNFLVSLLFWFYWFLRLQNALTCIATSFPRKIYFLDVIAYETRHYFICDHFDPSWLSHSIQFFQNMPNRYFEYTYSALINSKLQHLRLGQPSGHLNIWNLVSTNFHLHTVTLPLTKILLLKIQTFCCNQSFFMRFGQIYILNLYQAEQHLPWECSCVDLTVQGALTGFGQIEDIRCQTLSNERWICWKVQRSVYIFCWKLKSEPS